MNRFWMMGVAAVAVSVGVVALQVRPIRSSDNLLGTAQAQFAVKARDALIQRRMTQAQPIAPAALDAVPAISEIPNVVASREPVAMPTVAGSETPAAALAPEAPSLTRSTRDVAVAEPKLAAAPTIENIRAVEPPASENVVEPKAASSTAPIAAPAPEATTITPAVAKEAAVTPHEMVKVPHKMRRAPNEPTTNVVAHRAKRNTYEYSMSRNLQSLRAHAPEIAAMVAGYM